MGLYIKSVQISYNEPQKHERPDLCPICKLDMFQSPYHRTKLGGIIECHFRNRWIRINNQY
jgi:hypothetical protein